ncbi:MAG: CBS domain-containing protein [Tahibacter sp.]
MHAKDLMTANPVSCTADTDIRQIARLMRDTDCGQIPIVDSVASGKPVGVVTDRDIVVRLLAGDSNIDGAVAADCMSTTVVTVTPETSVSECCERMEAHQIRRIPVVDAAGTLCGIVALADLARSAREMATVAVVKEVSAQR